MDLQLVSFLLPHEVLAEMLPHAEQPLLFSTSGLDRLSLEALQNIRSQLNTEQVIPLSFWLDAIPFSWERDESLQAFTWGLPGIAEKPWNQLRFPFCALPKAMCAQETIDYVIKVWSWCMASLSVGKWPVGFDVLEGVELRGKVRTKMAGKPLGFKGAMVQMKMDWEALANQLHFPRWDNVSGICHCCHITRGDILEVELTAFWRQPGFPLRICWHISFHRADRSHLPGRYPISLHSESNWIGCIVLTRVYLPVSWAPFLYMRFVAQVCNTLEPHKRSEEPVCGICCRPGTSRSVYIVTG